MPCTKQPCCIQHTLGVSERLFFENEILMKQDCAGNNTNDLTLTKTISAAGVSIRT